MAHLDIVHGEAALLCDGIRHTPAGNDSLQAGDTLITAPDAFVQLKWLGRTTIVLPDSEVLFDARRRLVYVDLKRGGIHADVLPRKDRLILRTPNSQVTTEFSLRYSGDRTRLDMLRGQVRLCHDQTGEEQAVEAGMYAEIHGNGPIAMGRLVLKVVKISLVEEQRGLVRTHSYMRDDDVIRLDDPASRKVNFLIELQPPVVDYLKYNTSIKIGVERFFPYTLAGDKDGDYSWHELERGVHTMTLTPQSDDLPVESRTLHFTVK